MRRSLPGLIRSITMCSSVVPSKSGPLDDSCWLSAWNSDATPLSLAVS